MSDLKIDSYPNIRKAYLEMSYDNGGINIGRAEADALNESERVMGSISVSDEDLGRLDAWIGSLSEDQIVTLVAGEEGEARWLAMQGPTDCFSVPIADIFDELFEVC